MNLNPDSFLNDWYGYITNQAGHFMLGLFAALVVPWWVILGGYLTWEVASGWYGWDSIEDTVFVMLGVAFFKGARKYAMIVSMMIMSYGVFKRGRK